MTRKKPIQPQTEDHESKPFSKKDFINSIVKKKQKNKFLTESELKKLADSIKDFIKKQYETKT